MASKPRFGRPRPCVDRGRPVDLGGTTGGGFRSIPAAIPSQTSRIKQGRRTILPKVIKERQRKIILAIEISV